MDYLLCKNSLILIKIPMMIKIFLILVFLGLPMSLRVEHNYDEKVHSRVRTFYFLPSQWTSTSFYKF